MVFHTDCYNPIVQIWHQLVISIIMNVCYHFYKSRVLRRHKSHIKIQLKGIIRQIDFLMFFIVSWYLVCSIAIFVVS